MKVIGLFSGPGLLELGFQKAGFDVVASNELEGNRCKTLAANFKHDVLNVSAHKLSVEDLIKDYGFVDGIVGGFPCKTYSTIADVNNARAGVRLDGLRLRGEEKIPTYSRYAELGGDLFLHFFRIVANMQPRFFVIENVPGILGARIVRETFKRTPCNKNDLGYYYTLHEGILDAQAFGVPQRRPRYFFVGCAKRIDGPLRFQAPPTRRQLVVGDVLEANAEVDIPEAVAKRMAGIWRDKPIITQAGPDAVAPTCMSHYAKDRSTRLIQVDCEPARPYSPIEWRRLQGVPDDYVIEGSTTQVYEQVGDGVAVPVAYAVATAIRGVMN